MTFNQTLTKERISSAHKSFIDAVGEIPVKITADHQLDLQRMVARIGSVVNVFINEEVIDKGDVEGFNRAYACVTLEKTGYDRAVFIYTDGYNITLQSSSYNSYQGFDWEDKVVIKDIDFDNYNWIEFVDKLLHFVHKVIYARVKSYETKIFEKGE